jgi:predicted alpha/beta hydrolase family esterase
MEPRVLPPKHTFRGAFLSHRDEKAPRGRDPEARMHEIAQELDCDDPASLVVACHSLGAITWLHLAARSQRRLVERVLLAAAASTRDRLRPVARRPRLG